MIYQGKSAAKRGESVAQMNRDFHKAYNEAADEKERKAKEAAGAWICDLQRIQKDINKLERVLTKKLNKIVHKRGYESWFCI